MGRENQSEEQGKRKPSDSSTTQNTSPTTYHMSEENK
jgi:hypothetical protein